MQTSQQASQSNNTARTLLWIAVAGFVLLLLWQVGTLILLLFGGVLFGVLLHGLAQWIDRHTPLSMGWALGLVYIGFAALFVGAGLYLGPQVAGQLGDLLSRTETLVRQIQDWLSQYDWAQNLLNRAVPEDISPAVSTMLGQITGLATGTLAFFGGVVVVLFLGVYLSWDPGLYSRGMLWLVPPDRRDRARQILHSLYETLRWWLIGRIISMALVGILTGLGLWLVGAPLILTLAFLAALLDFIPYIGPIIAAIPAIAIGLTIGPAETLWIIAVYVVVQSIESYLITPLVQLRTIHLPPALTVAIQILFGTIFGVIGIAVATPLVAVLIVLVRMVYVEDMLGDRRVPDPMEDDGDEEPVEP